MGLPIRVLLVDDHTMFREGVRIRLDLESDFEVVGEAETAGQALTLVGELEPEVVILDIRLPDLSGIELTRQIRGKWPDVKILVLSGYDFDQYVRALARLGIQGYLLKLSPQDTLVQAIRDIAAGGVVLPPNIASKVMQGYSSATSKPRDRELWELTVRELEILELLYQGLRNAEIASRLTISVRTVEAHVGNVISKLGAESRTDSVRIALDKGLIK